MPMGRDDHAKAIEDQGFKFLYNPPEGGNCQFAALLHQANRMRILRSPETTSKEIVEYLKSNPFASDGFPLPLEQTRRSLNQKMKSIIA